MNPGLVLLDLGSDFQDAVTSGSMLLAVPVAVVAGLVSFFSPCVLPLLPGYLSYATGLSGTDLNDAKRGRLLLGSVLFVLGFTVVFVSTGALFGFIGDWLYDYRRALSIGLGVVTIVVGLVFLGAFPFLQRDVRFHRVPRGGLLAAPLLGLVFGLGWTPCMGPTLAAVYSLSVAEGSAVRGAVLSLFFSLGLGVPFLLAGLAWRKTLGAVGFIRRHQVWVIRFGGALLLVLGVLLVSGLWDSMVGLLRSSIAGFEVPV